MQRGHPYPMQQLFPYAECVSRARIEAEFLNVSFFFIFLLLFFIFLFIFIPLARARKCIHTRFRHVHNDTFPRNSDVYTLDSTIKGRGSWSWNCKQDISSIDQTSPHPPITISEFIERINYFVTRDKHVKTNFGNAGFTCLLAEFTGGLLVLIRLPLNYARGSSPEIKSESSKRLKKLGRPRKYAESGQRTDIPC